MNNIVTATTPKPKDGLAGLAAHWQQDALTGFIVFLLALPLSLGIAKASEFPPIMGIITAIIGGLVVSMFAGSRLTIKGPAAGLIVIVAGAVAEFGGGDQGWHYALGAIVVAGMLQVLFGVFKLGKLTDVFPLSAIHGMLAAIGIIIISKQVHVLLDVDPALTKGKEPFELLAMIPQSLLHLDWKATFIGVICLFIMLGWPMLKNKWLKKIPAPLVVLLVAIPAELAFDFEHTEPKYALVHLGNLLDNLGVNVSFGGISHALVFAKYVLMFALVGTLESLLTVKAIDMLDPWRRKSNANKDLIAVGLGNIVSGILGGLPMISEVARSSANVANGAHTRWSNFFHGFWLLLFVLLAAPIIELIPNCALAAMLISVGIRLAHPREFAHMFKIGPSQLIVFVVTIIATLAVDLLVGIAAGMLCKIIIHLLNGKPLSSIFKAPTSVSFTDDSYYVSISKAAVFTNLIGIKDKLYAIPYGFNVVIDLQHTRLVDHTVLENLQHFKHDYEAAGGQVEIVGLDDHQPMGKHHLAARKKRKHKHRH
ncbi:MAG: SulP family inorganic anion transporter [Chitinophagaceae bacterium]|jgi:MFS superfamily sulfate permease-like transporter|nr:SulP family inorganic anion transporter [Chitinophagaceae bacterium]